MINLLPTAEPMEQQQLGFAPPVNTPAVIPMPGQAPQAPQAPIGEQPIAPQQRGQMAGQALDVMARNK